MTSKSLILTIIFFSISNDAFSAQTFIVRHGNWEAFTEKQGSHLVCSIGAEPIKKEGNYKYRGQTYILVTHRPSEKSSNVVSVVAGYNFKKGSEATLIMGKKKTKLFTDGSHAFAHNSKTDNLLVKSMIKGSTMVFKGVSSRGTKTTDTYSLTGFTAAYKSMNAACK